jgi:hypothetical protein
MVIIQITKLIGQEDLDALNSKVLNIWHKSATKHNQQTTIR